MGKYDLMLLDGDVNETINSQLEILTSNSGEDFFIRFVMSIDVSFCDMLVICMEYVSILIYRRKLKWPEIENL